MTRLEALRKRLPGITEEDLFWLMDRLDELAKACRAWVSYTQAGDPGVRVATRQSLANLEEKTEKS